MPPDPVIEALDILEDGLPGLTACLKALICNALALRSLQFPLKSTGQGHRYARPRSNTRRTTGSARKFERLASSSIFAASFCTIAIALANAWYARSLCPEDAYSFPRATSICHSSPGSPMTLSVVKYGEFNDPMMGHRIGYSAEGRIKRKDFGLTFDMILDGKFVVSEEVQIMIEGEFVEQKQEPTADAASA
jgi:hypothetical protein